MAVLLGIQKWPQMKILMHVFFCNSYFFCLFKHICTQLYIVMQFYILFLWVTHIYTVLHMFIQFYISILCVIHIYTVLHFVPLRYTYLYSLPYFVCLDSACLSVHKVWSSIVLLCIGSIYLYVTCTLHNNIRIFNFPFFFPTPLSSSLSCIVFLTFTFVGFWKCILLSCLRGLCVF
jgi:hypothetical protein